MAAVAAVASFGGSAASSPAWSRVLTALEDSRRRGFLGPDQEPDAVARHAAGFAAAVDGCRRVMDLGSGGGVPGVVLAVLLPGATVALVDASVSRTDWLHRLVHRLGLAERVEVVTARAEVLGHDPAWRENWDAVVARSFAPPMVTAECATAFLRVGGRLVVSEPPGGRRDERWPTPGLDDLGLSRVTWPDAAYAVFEKRAACSPEVPRAGRVRGRTS